MESSIILTIHNKEFLLPKTLDAIKQFTDFSNTELIFVIDGCTDGSKRQVDNFRFCNRHIPINIIETPDLFETKANNVGCKLSQADYVIILQDDQVINQIGWNREILRPFELWDDVFAVSGNCAHNWSKNNNLSASGRTKEGWSDLLIHHDHANKTNIDKNTFAVRDSCNRGPLAINRKDFEYLGGFCPLFAPQDSDDHCLMYDAKRKLNKVCGFINIDWYSEPAWGGTRNEDGSTKQWMLDANVKNADLLFDLHYDIMNTHTIENRILC